MFALVLAVCTAAPTPTASVALDAPPPAATPVASIVDGVVGDGEVAPDHDFKVRWPKGTPKGVVVFLHGVSIDPFALDEEGTGIEALGDLANRRGLVAVFPLGYRACDWDRP